MRLTSSYKANQYILMESNSTKETLIYKITNNLDSNMIMSNTQIRWPTLTLFCSLHSHSIHLLNLLFNLILSPQLKPQQWRISSIFIFFPSFCHSLSPLLLSPPETPPSSSASRTPSSKTQMAFSTTGTIPLPPVTGLPLLAIITHLILFQSTSPILGVSPDLSRRTSVGFRHCVTSASGTTASMVASLPPLSLYVLMLHF